MGLADITAGGFSTGRGMRACSGCAGDYEDPDRTVPDQDECDEELEAEMERDRDGRIELEDGMPAECEKLPVTSATAEGTAVEEFPELRVKAAGMEE